MVTSPDRAASSIALVAGILLIIPSVAALIVFRKDLDEGGDLDHGLINLTGTTDREFLITWSTEDVDSKDLIIMDGAQSAKASIRANDTFTAQVLLEFGPCDDTFTAPLQGPVTVSWHLSRDIPGFDEDGTYTCDNVPDDLRFNVTDAPDYASAKAGSAEDARQQAWAALQGNATETFTLELSWVREPGSVPLTIPPQVPARFSAEVTFTVLRWQANADLPPEVVR